MRHLWEGHRDALNALAATQLWRECAERFLDFAAPEAVEHLLHVSTGDGLLTAHLSRSGACVHTLDSALMSSGAASQSSAGPSDGVELICLALSLPSPQVRTELLSRVRPGGVVAVILPALNPDLSRVMALPALQGVGAGERAHITEALEALGAEGYTDLDAARWFTDASMLAVRTSFLMENALLIAKGRRP